MNLTERRKRLQELKEQKKSGNNSAATSAATGSTNYSSSRAKRLDEIKHAEQQERLSAVSSELSSRINTWFKNNENFVSNYNYRFKGFTGSYDDPYDSTINDWISNVTAQKSNFDAEAASIRAIIEENRDYLNPDYVNEVLSAFDTASRVQGDILSNATGRAKYWSQWENADAYKRYQKISSIYDMSSEQIKPYLTSDNPVAFTTDDGQEVTWDYLYKTKFYEELMGGEDFEEYSQIGASVKNPSYAAANGSDNFLGWKNPFAKGEEIGNIVTFSRENIDEIIKAMGGANSNADLAGVVGDYRYQYMTDDEVAIYNYYLGKGDTEKAAEYLVELDEALNYRWGEKIADRADSNAVSKLVFGLGEGLDQFVSGAQNIKNFITGDEGIATTPTQFASSIIREDLDTIGRVAYDLAQTTGNMLPSILVGGIAGPVLGTATMSASVAGNGYSEMRKLGYDEWQARGYGLLVGASEGVLQYALGGIGKLGGKVTNHAISNIVSKFDNAIARVAIDLGGKMLSEGLEEAVQSVLEPAFKLLVTGEGYNVDWEEVFYSGLLGALSAGLLEGTPTIAETVSSSSAANKLYGDNVQDLVTESLEIDPENAHAQRMQAKLDSGKKVSGYQLNRLAEANEPSMVKNDAASIQSAAESRLTELGERGDVKKIAAALTKQAKGERLTFTEREAIKSSTYGERVANELNTENIKSGGYSSAWAEKIGTDRINAEEYGRLLAEIETEESSATVSKMEQVQNEADTQQVTGKLPASKADFATDTNVGSKSAQTPTEASEGLSDEVEAKGTTYETAEAKDTQMGKVEAVGDSSKTTIKSDGMDVNVKITEIASVDNGAVTVRLENGETVNANEIDFGNEDTALVYQAAADMSTRVGGFNADTVRVMVNGFDPSMGLNASEYVHGFRDAYRYGAEGAPISELARGEFTSKLTEEQRNRAFHFGRAFGNEEVAQKQAQLDAKKKRDLKKHSENAKIDSKTTKEGDGAMAGNENTSYYDGDRNALNERQRVSVEFLEKVFGSRGVKITFIDSYIDESGRRVYKNSRGQIVPAPNGYYNPADGSIVIDINAGQGGEGLILNTASHELTHFIKDWSPKKFRTFAEFLYEVYGESGIPLEAFIQDKIAKAKKNGRTISRELALEEFVADSSEMMLVDIINNKNQENLKKLIAKDKTLFEKIKEFFTELLERIKAAYKGINPQTLESAYIREMRDVADRLQTMWTEALLDATDTYREISENVTEKSGEVKLSDRDSDGKELSEGQFEYFKDSRVRDEKGNLLVMYHGTPNAGFTKFKSGTYFTQHKWYADRYQSPGASSLGPKRTADNPDTYAVYLNIKKPFDTRNNAERDIFYNEYYRQWGTGTDLMESGLPDWLDGMDLQEFIEEMGYDYDGLILDEGATGGYGEEVVSRGISYVIFDAAQAKNIDNENPTDDPDIRYSFRNSESGMANDALRPYNEELTGFIKNNGNYIVDSFEKMEQIVNLAFDNPTHKATAYFGIINADNLDKIKNSIPNLPKTSKDILFKTGRDYSIATTLDSIRHIVDGKALTREDVINYLDRFADTILEFDSVTYDTYTDSYGNKLSGLLFKKRFSDGVLVSFDLVSNKKRSVVLQTLYLNRADYQKKKSAETLPMHKANGNTSKTQVGQTSKRSAETLPVHKASAHTPRAGVGQTSIDIISQNKENVNSNISENVETEDTEDIRYSDRDDFYELKRELKEKYGVDTEAVLGLADGYLQNYGGVLNKTQFRRQFLDLTLEAAKFMSDTSVESIGRVNDMVLETATEIVNNPAVTGELVDELRKIKKHIKDTRIKIPSGRKGDFDVFGGFEAFRRKHWGSLTLTHDGIDVDSIYPEFQELFGKSWFPDNIDNVSDQLIRIAEVVDTPLSEVSENYYNPDEIMIDVAGEIFDKVQTIALNASENMARINYRNADSVSPRAMLAGALESVAQNDIEKNKLKAYKEKIGKMNAEEQKLQELRREIKELSFAAGPRDTARIEALREEATKTANRIGIYDKQLLELEASRPLRDVLQRERHKAYKRAEAEGREALAKYRERAAKTQEELKRRYQESKKRGTENRRKTEIRNKIKRTVGELNDMLLHGSKNRNIKSGLQEAVAAALEAINMDTVAADERIAKYNALIAKATDEDVIASLVQTRDNIRRQGDALGDKLETMRKAYRDIREKDANSEYPDYFKAEAKLIESRIESVIDKVGNTPLRNMSYAQLDAVYDMYKMVLATVRNANAVFKAGKIEDLQKNVSSVMTELSAIPKLPEERSAIIDKMRGYEWNEYIPYYAFKRIGSATFESFYWEAIKGQDIYARDINEAQSFASEAREKYHYDAWDFDKVHEFRLADGRKFSVSLKHMMSVYAYSKRAQAGDHMRKGGFFFNDKETFRKKGGVLEMIRDSEASYKLDDGALAAIISAMTEEQRKYVDDMQAYMTQMGEKGNEVTRILWGIDLFKEKVYFPLKSSKDFIYQANQPVQESSLKNDGMTKETKPGASNPIVLEAFDEVWAAHVNRMSQYHAFVLPIENLNKVLNYGTWANTDAVAVSTMLRSRYGSAVNDYLNQFIGDLNGVKNSQGATFAFFGSMFTKFKKTAVAGSLSVVVQQPTAILRAQAEIDAKYFVGKPNMEKLSEKWEEIKKYAPIAIIKEIGGFEAGAGRQTTEWLNADTQRGLEKVSSKIDEATMWGAAKADQLGWSMIWEAVKRETISKHHDLVPTSEEFLKLVGERFTEVIVKTQVYDSTLSRSGYMRSKNELTKMMTSFMGEPTVSANMLYDSMIEAKRGRISMGTAARRIGAVYLASVAATLAKSLIYALRDDDEDESYLQKYAQALGGAVLNDINPLTWLPGVRDVLSIFDGWEVERSDMALFQDLKNAIDGLDSENKSTWRKIEDFAGAVAGLFGVPLKNVMRTAREVYNGFENMVDGVSGGDFGEALLEGVTGKDAGKSKSLYDAIMSGDEERLAIYRADYKSEDAYDAALRKAIRENDPRIKEAAAARYNGDIAEYMRIAKEIIGEGNFSQDNVVAAINSAMSALIKAAESGYDTSDEQSDKLESIYSVDDFYKAIRGYDLATAYAVREDIINVAIENGEDREDAEKAFESDVASHVWEQYKSGLIEDEGAEDMLINYGGKSESEAASRVRYWAFKLENPKYDDFYESDVNKYYDGYYKEGELYGKSAASYGISLDIYAEYVREKSGLSKKEDIMYIINTLPLTKEQKDALYYLNGWAKSTIREAPWR